MPVAEGPGLSTITARGPAAQGELAGEGGVQLTPHSLCSHCVQALSFCGGFKCYLGSA